MRSCCRVPSCFWGADRRGLCTKTGTGPLPVADPESQRQRVRVCPRFCAQPSPSESRPAVQNSGLSVTRQLRQILPVRHEPCSLTNSLAAHLRKVAAGTILRTAKGLCQSRVAAKAEVDRMHGSHSWRSYKRPRGIVRFTKSGREAWHVQRRNYVSRGDQSPSSDPKTPVLILPAIDLSRLFGRPSFVPSTDFTSTDFEFTVFDYTVPLCRSTRHSGASL